MGVEEWCWDVGWMGGEWITLTKQDNTCKFSRRSSFSSTYKKQQKSPPINSTYLVSVGCGRLVEGKGMRLSLVPFFFRQPPMSNWHKISWINWSFIVFLLYVAWKRGLPQKIAHFVLFRLIKKLSFNLLCVLDLFQNSGSQFCFRFFC